MALSAGIKEGDRVEVTQAIVKRDQTWDNTVVGTVIGMEEKPTGSWYAHGRHGRLWLPRLRLRKDDGEITSLVLDGGTRIRHV